MLLDSRDILNRQEKDAANKIYKEINDYYMEKIKKLKNHQKAENAKEALDKINEERWRNTVSKKGLLNILEAYENAEKNLNRSNTLRTLEMCWAILSQVNPKNEEELFSKKSVSEFVRETLGLGDCAFHAAWSQLEQELKRSKEIIDFITNGAKDKKELVEFRHQFNHCLNLEQGKLYNWISSDKDLNDKFIAFKKAFNQGFDLSACILADRSNVLTEYANYIAKPGQWLLPLEFHLIAYAFDLNIKFYTYNPYKKIRSGPEDINPTGKKEVGVCFDGIGHFERVGAEVESAAVASNAATSSTATGVPAIPTHTPLSKEKEE